MNIKKQMIAYAMLRELYNDHKDFIFILQKFIEHTITLEKYEVFSIEELESSFQNIFEFKIPKAVLKIALNKLKRNKIVEKENKKYKYLGALDKTFEKQFDKLTEKYDFLIKQLLITLNKTREKKITIDSIAKILLDYYSDELKDTNLKEEISKFITDNQYNPEYYEILNNMMEGFFLYLGVSYNITNIHEIGYWKKEIIIILESDILLSSYGYNGENLKKEFEDFYHLVSEINKYKKYITLYYLSETKKEMENIFNEVENSFKDIYPKSAHSIIRSKCEKCSDVIEEKVKFFSILKRMNIQEYPEIGIDNIENERYNLISQEYINKYSTILKEMIRDNNENFEKNIENYVESIMCSLTKINIIRKGKEENNLLDSKCILITNNKKIITIALKENNPEKIPLAISLNHIIVALWFKLGKSFEISGSQNRSLEVITRAQLVLNSIFDSKISNKIKEIKEKNLEPEHLKLLLYELKKIENLAKEDVNVALDDIDEYSIEDIINEKERKEEKLKEQTILIQKHEETISEKDHQIEELKSEVDKYEKNKNTFIRTIIRIMSIIINSLIICGIYFLMKYIFIKYYITSKDIVILILGVTIPSIWGLKKYFNRLKYFWNYKKDNL